MATTSFAQPGRTSKEIKYPPRGLIQLAISNPASSSSNVFNTASNILETGKTPLLIGGDHSCVIGSALAIEAKS